MQNVAELLNKALSELAKQMRPAVQNFIVPLMQIGEWLDSFALQFGYLGVFAVSLVGSMSILIPIPYTLAVYLLGAVLDPFLVAAAAGLGSALGEFSGYLLGYYGRAAISEERKRKIDFMMRIFDSYGSLIVFLFALAPLPDDLLFIPLGIMHESFLRVFLPCFLGKTVMSLILAFGGKFSIGFIRDVLAGEGGWLTAIITSVLLVATIIVMLRLDWENIFTKYFEEKGKDVRKQTTRT